MKKFSMYCRKKKKNQFVNRVGQLSKSNILNELNQSNGLAIRLGVGEDDVVKNRVHSASYDLTPSIVAMSSKLGMLETVYRSESLNTNSYYILVKPKDTVLIVSNEFICLPPNVSGYVTSRVSNVVRGFGHISTTVDPNWNGALLIALSNPSNHPIKVQVGTTTIRDKSGDYLLAEKQNTLATLTLHYLCGSHDNSTLKYKNMRVDLLRKVKYDQKRGILAWFRRKIHFKRRKYTDYFFDYLYAYENNLQTPEGWSEFLDEFSKVIYDEKDTKVVIASDFVIKENIFRRMIRFIIEHISSILYFIVILLFILYKFGLIHHNILEIIVEWLV